MTSDMFWIGLDIGEIEAHICVIDDKNRTHLEAVSPTSVSAMLDALSGIPQDQIAAIVIEAGTGRNLASGLKRKRYPVHLVDARKAKKFLEIRYHKTDINDARGLAELGRLGYAERTQVHLKSAEIQNLRARLVMRDQLLKQKVALRNALRALLVDRHLGTKLPPHTKLKSELLPIIIQHDQDTGDELAGQISPLLGVLEAIKDYLYLADRHLERVAKDNAVMERLMGIPGVGHICAISFYTAVENPHRFGRSADVGAYLGMIPRVKQSGAIIQKSRISKAGNKLTRGHLVMAAAAVLRRAPKGEFSDWASDLAKRIGYTKAKVAVARKLAVLMLSMWKSGESFRPYPKSASL